MALYFHTGQRDPWEIVIRLLEVNKVTLISYFLITTSTNFRKFELTYTRMHLHKIQITD